MANAVAFFLLISSPAAPELTDVLLKNSPVPPPLGVWAKILVIAVAVGSPDLFAGNVSTSSMTTDPVLFALMASEVSKAILITGALKVF